MSLKIYNVMSGKKEEFIPLEEGKVKMYACGITVSDNAHIGHAYQATIFDTIRKYLEFIGYDVKYVRNYTDVDDKIIINARKVGKNPLEYAEEYIKKTDIELDKLGLRRPDVMSRATECISDIIEFVEKLIEKGHAYSTEDGCVYFKVSSFPEYGKLSHNQIDETISGVRKEVEPGKLDDRDFALWKSAGDDEIFWDSPWGKGRPGWHIECSTMSIKYLGEMLDIHGGGKDLRFPHHENEIAQSESLTGKEFAKYWVHNGLVRVNGQKMSKSLGNGILLEDLLNNYNSDVIKLTLLQNNYRSDLNIVDGIFEQNEQLIYNYYKMIKTIEENSKDLKIDNNSNEYKEVKDAFIEAMDNDFNTSAALSYLYNYLNTLNKLLKDKNYQSALNMISSIKDCYKVLGLFESDPESVISELKNKYLNIINMSEKEIVKLLNDRIKYKEEKDFENADKIRNELMEKGILINDRVSMLEYDIDFSKFGKKN